MKCKNWEDLKIINFNKIKEKYIDKGKERLILRDLKFDKREKDEVMMERWEKEENYLKMIEIFLRKKKKWEKEEEGKEEMMKIEKLEGFKKE